jgi:3-oxoadipate enol-lactonase
MTTPTLAYHRAGNGSRPPLVLLHGFPHDREVWAAQFAAADTVLSGQPLLIPDLPGFGQSPPVTPATLDAYAGALLAWLDALQIQHIVLGGLSLGGYLAFALWRRAPERIAALILCDTRATPDSDEQRAKRLETIALATAEGPGPIAARQREPQLGKTTRRTRPDLVAALDAILLRAPVRGIVDASRAMADRPDSTPTLETITVPTLIVVGEEDVVTTVDEALAMQALIPRSRLIRVAEAGHLAPFEQPVVVNAAIAEFLDTAL